MVSFTPTDDQQALIDTIRRYALTDVRQVAHESDEGGAFPDAVIDKGWAIGLVPTAIPEAHGGLGELSALTGVLAAEELAFGDLSAAVAVMMPALAALPLILYGTDEQQARWLPQFMDAQPPRATAALLEPGVLFDPFALTTTATADGDGWRLNGSKAVVPGGAQADLVLVYAREVDSGAISGFLVEGGATGLTVTGEEKLMGLRGLSTARLAFSDVRVQAAGKLAVDYPALINRCRVAQAALAVGVARSASEYAREYAKGRQTFGAPIATRQAIAFMLAEMAIEVDAARLMAWDAAWQIDQGQDATAAAALAKQYADRAVLAVTDSGVQVLGGYGFIREYPAERWLRNARGFSSFEGLAIV